MDRKQFLAESSRALEHIESVLGDLEHEQLDPDLAADVLTLSFEDGTRFIINAHSAAEQIWMAANKSAWHFDLDADSGEWIAAKTGDELMATVGRVVGEKLGISIEV